MHKKSGIDGEEPRKRAPLRAPFLKREPIHLPQVYETEIPVVFTSQNQPPGITQAIT